MELKELIESINVLVDKCAADGQGDTAGILAACGVLIATGLEKEGVRLLAILLPEIKERKEKIYDNPQQ